MKIKLFVTVKGINGNLIPLNPFQICSIDRAADNGKQIFGQSLIFFAGTFLRVMGEPTEVALKIEAQLNEAREVGNGHDSHVQQAKDT